jgi:hypothetical protein
VQTLWDAVLHNPFCSQSEQRLWFRLQFRQDLIERDSQRGLTGAAGDVDGDDAAGQITEWATTLIGHQSSIVLENILEPAATFTHPARSAIQKLGAFKSFARIMLKASKR